ncbi:MAG: anaerobic sulfatase maturase [Candidatus Electrothrix sp. GM3_4]|nr:anaerobic sulfatase maturase [Candidatus Electrothrix sp. GM3_4]
MDDYFHPVPLACFLADMSCHMRSVIIKPVGSFCNLQCEYCFYLEKHQLYKGVPSTHRMPDDILEKLIRNMFSCTDNPTFVWHGGEPLLAGLNFFSKAVALQKRYAEGRPYANAMQTNGTLLDEDWAAFLRDEKFLVGISLDGPEHVHDRYRKDHKGNGTFQQVFDNCMMLLSQGVQVNVLATVNDYSVQFPFEIYTFFKQNGLIFMQFNPVVESHPEDPTAAAPFSVDALEYGKFLRRLFKIWVRDFDFNKLRQKTSIRFFDALIHRYIGMVPDQCMFQQKCGNALIVEHNGDLFSCDYLVSEDTRIGTLYEGSLRQAFNSNTHQIFSEKKADLPPKCLKCRWLKLCYGGCMKDRIRDPQDKGMNRFCRSYQFFFREADQQLKQFARLYKENY